MRTQTNTHTTQQTAAQASTHAHQVPACALPRRRAHESSRIEWCKIRHNAAAGAAANSRRAAASEFARGTGRCVCECNMHELVCVACSDVDGHLRQTTPYPVRSAKLSCLKLG
jgi:hypothetical protein